MTDSSETLAVCDTDAFLPLRDLVQGPFTHSEQLNQIERLVRGIVLHDRMIMDLNPWPDTGSVGEVELDGEIEDETGPRNVIVGIGPVLDGFENLVAYAQRSSTYFHDVTLSDDLLRLAEEKSNAGPGNPFYQAHVDYFKRTISILDGGGSAILEGDPGRALEMLGGKYPAALFERLDQEWSQYARECEDGDLGLEVPPVLAIILARAKNREDIPRILVGLRDEWTSSRRRVWNLIHQLRVASTMKEAHKIRRELAEASRYFCPDSARDRLRPIRIFWNIIGVAVGGAVDAVSAGGDPMVGAATGASREVISSIVTGGRDFAKLLFGHGAFDLARRVRKDLIKLEPLGKLLERHLSAEERDRLQAGR